MDRKLTSLDWSLVQAFLAVAKAGSLSGAARLLQASQPTIGRQIQRIEQELGLTLFHRRARGLDLTDQGRLVLPAARAMQDAAGHMALIAAGQDTALAGSVRITASDVVAHLVLPRILAKLRQLEPGIHIELVPSDTTENLLFREADIAIRMYRPTQLEVITRHVGDIPVGIFGAQSYLERVGFPKDVADLRNFDLIGFDKNDLILRGMADMGLVVEREWFVIRTDDQAAYWQLVRAGCGLGAGQMVVAHSDPDIVTLFPDLQIPGLPVWLTAHEVMRNTPRIRRVWDFLVEELQAAILDPNRQAG